MAAAPDAAERRQGPVEHGHTVTVADRGQHRLCGLSRGGDGRGGGVGGEKSAEIDEGKSGSQDEAGFDEITACFHVG